MKKKKIVIIVVAIIVILVAYLVLPRLIIFATRDARKAEYETVDAAIATWAESRGVKKPRLATQYFTSPFLRYRTEAIMLYGALEPSQQDDLLGTLRMTPGMPIPIEVRFFRDDGSIRIETIETVE